MKTKTLTPRLGEDERALYPDLESEDLKQTVAFAARAVDQREIALAS